MLNWNKIKQLLDSTYMTSSYINRDALYSMYVEYQLSMRDIGEVLGCSVAKVYRDLNHYNIPTRKPGQRAKLLTEPLPKFTDYKWGYGQHPVLLRQPRLVNSMGYVQLYLPEHKLADKNGYVYEHRLVAEELLKRELLPDEVVHHRDGNKQNNSPENLDVMTTSRHSSLGHNLMNKFKAVKPHDPKTEEEWLKIAGEVYSVFCKKNSDYGPNNIAGLGVEGVVVRLFDKFMRLKNLTFEKHTEESVDDEKVEDTVIDIIDYGIIFLLVKRGLWPEYQEPDFSNWEELESFKELSLGELPSLKIPSDFGHKWEKLEMTQQKLQEYIQGKVKWDE